MRGEFEKELMSAMTAEGEGPEGGDGVEIEIETGGDEEAPSGGGGTLFISPADLGKGVSVKAGDTLTFEVVGTDEEGNIEIKMAGGAPQPSMADELRSAVAEPGGMPEDLQEGY